MCSENGNYPLREEVTEFQKEELLERFFNGSDLSTTIRVLLNLMGEFLTQWGLIFVSLVFEFPEPLAAVRQESQ